MEETTGSSESPAVSVVITAYNEEAYIEETLESVLTQTYRDFEVVVVDDGSTDRTAEIVKSYGAPVRYLHQENRGQPAARNTGIRAACGRFVAFLDADDLWHPGKLQVQMHLFEAQPACRWAYTDAFFFESETERILRTASQGRSLPSGEVRRALLLGNFILSPTPMVRRDVFEAVGYFNESPEVRNGEDWEMWLRLAECFPVGVVRRPLALVREHRARMSQSVDLGYALGSRLTILEEALRRQQEGDQRLWRRARSNVYVAIGRWALEREERPAALRLFAKALREAPENRQAWVYAAATLLPRPLLRLLGRVREAAWAAEHDGPATVAEVLHQAELAGA